MTPAEQFQEITKEKNEDKVLLFLYGANKTVLGKTNRQEMIPELEQFAIDLAIARYFKDGEQGLSGSNEGGVSHSYMSEDEILKGISQYRLSPQARRVLDAKKKDEKFQT